MDQASVILGRKSTLLAIEHLPLFNWLQVHGAAQSRASQLLAYGQPRRDLRVIVLDSVFLFPEQWFDPLQGESLGRRCSSF